jgi:hypothetical protein
MKDQPTFLLLGFCFVLAGAIKVFEICSIDFFKIKSTDFLVVLGVTFLTCICWAISRVIPLLIHYFEVQDKMAHLAISNSFFGAEEDENNLKLAPHMPEDAD